ncbi:MAG: hypothetical protein K9J42_15750 [Sulfuritalea sp.]|nr:hypothetical protein [Sulfuritalea sp.]
MKILKTIGRAFPCIVLAASLGGCANNMTVLPDLKITREIPADAALAWLKRVAAKFGETRIPACRYDGTGILPGDGDKPIPWKQLHTKPYEILNLSGDLGYAVYATQERNTVAGWVVIEPKNARTGLVTIGIGDKCSAYYAHHKTATEAQIADTQKGVERSLSALAALGVEIVRKEPSK